MTSNIKTESIFNNFKLNGTTSESPLQQFHIEKEYQNKLNNLKKRHIIYLLFSNVCLLFLMQWNSSFTKSDSHSNLNIEDKLTKYFPLRMKTLDLPILSKDIQKFHLIDSKENLISSKVYIKKTTNTFDERSANLHSENENHEVTLYIHPNDFLKAKKVQQGTVKFIPVEIPLKTKKKNRARLKEQSYEIFI